MRKYQQLVLVAVSVLSIICLLIYRSENYRLQYVLDVVNFFGQKERIHKEDISFEYTSPFPIWQRIGNGFHAYSSFWHHDSSEITTIVVGMKHSQVSFKCEADIGGNSSTLIPGKFGFLREEVKSNASPLPPSISKTAEEYMIYKFICKLKETAGTPKTIIFTDVTTTARHSIGVRDLARHNSTHQQQMVSCVNLISPTSDAVRRFYEAEPNLLEYFYHHQVLGVDEFIVYDNTDLMTLFVKKELAHHGINANLLPFNFPFEMGTDQQIRRILQMDCELRTLNISRYFVAAQPNEYLYSDAFLNAENSTLHSIGKQSKPRFAIPTNNVCFNTSETRWMKLISENKLIADKRDIKTPALVDLNAFILHRPSVNPGQASLEKWPESRMFVNRYVECVPMDQHDEATHNTWPTTIEHSISHQFMHFLDTASIEVVKMKLKIQAT